VLDWRHLRRRQTLLNRKGAQRVPLLIHNSAGREQSILTCASVPSTVDAAFSAQREELPLFDLTASPLRSTITN
jgi:hypothetical protein